MSITLEMVPLYLALRAVMNKTDLEHFADGMEIRFKTHFRSKNELILAVKAAGYQVEEFANSLKTQLHGDENHMFWDQINGEWFATFSVFGSKEIIKRFVSDIETSANRPLIEMPENWETLAEMPDKLFPTNFTDADMLISTLKDLGVKAEQKPNGEITCVVQKSHLTFQPTDNGPYTIRVTNLPNSPDLPRQLKMLDQDYKRLAQAKTYENLKKRIENRNLTIEEEEVLDDNSIMITLTIQE